MAANETVIKSDSNAPITFELSPLQEEWIAGAYPSCATMLCFCCSSPKIGPRCPPGSGVISVNRSYMDE